MLLQRDLYSCAWHTILLHGAAGAERAADERIAQMRSDGSVAGAEMWESIKSCIPELLNDPDLWDDLPQDGEFVFTL